MVRNCVRRLRPAVPPTHPSSFTAIQGKWRHVVVGHEGTVEEGKQPMRWRLTVSNLRVAVSKFSLRVCRGNVAATPVIKITGCDELNRGNSGSFRRVW